jgi:PhoPQ-activated pathogenicity-related protein
VKRAFFFVLVAAYNVAAHGDLASYVSKPDDSYKYEVTASEPVGELTAYSIRLTSQTWQGIVWSHWLTVFQPKEIKYDKAMLLISGGDNSNTSPRTNSGEAKTMQQIAQSTGTVTAMLEQVPNQPLFDGLKEDGIIALTFEKYLKGEGEDWPLLLPMVKSAVRAMDTIQAVVKDKSGKEVNGFMTLGGSKRGWTTWLSAVADKRVVGIAPIVIDMLNMVPQSELQLASYGEFSEEIKDYTERGIQAYSKTDAGATLRSIVDPFSYCDQLTLPKLVVLGTNDPYWNVDSSNNYFPYLKGDKSLYYCANTKHDINGGGIAAIKAFYQSLLTGEKMPTIGWENHPDNTLAVTWSDPEGQAKLWKAVSDTRDFRPSKFESTDLPGSGSANATLETPKIGWAAYYIEVTMPSPASGRFGLCTGVTVLPDTFPFPNAAEHASARGTNSDLK